MVKATIDGKKVGEAVAVYVVREGRISKVLFLGSQQ